MVEIPVTPRAGSKRSAATVSGEWARVLLTALALSASAAWASPEHYLYDIWQHEEGLPQISVIALAQDGDGYLWLGTLEGLVRFDGLGFTVFNRSNTPQLRSNIVTAIAPDGDGSLWVGTREGLARWQDGRLTDYTPEEAPTFDVQLLHLDRRGRLWVGTRHGLHRFDGDRFITYTTRDGLIHNFVWAIQDDRQGNLWIGTQGGLSRLRDGTFTSYTIRDGLTHDHVRALYEDRRGRLWIGTTEGIQRLEQGRFITSTPGSGPARPTVRLFYEDHHGDLWIGALGGLYRLTRDVFTFYGKEAGLPDNRVRAVLEDREGSLWIGTRLGGLCRLRERRITHFGSAEGLPSDVVWAIRQDRAGNVWLGTDGGLARIAPDGGVITYTTRDGLPSNEVWSLFEDRRGTLWVGTCAHGLARLRDGEFRVTPIAEGPGEACVTCILEDRAGNLWLGTDSAGLHRLGNEELRTYTVRDGLPSNGIRDLYEDPQGILRIATADGLTRYENGVFTTIGSRHGLAHPSLASLYGDREGILWIGTWGGGLSRFRDGELADFSIQDGLFDELVHQVLEDSRERLWMSSNRGIFNVGKQELDDYAAGRTSGITSASYGRSDGMRSNECNGRGDPAGWRTRDGKLWFPTIKGAAIVDADRIERNAVPPNVVIEEVLIDKQPTDPDRRAVLPAGTTVFEFRYVALSFLAPEKIRYQYMLEDFDDDWQDAGTRRLVHYTNLNPGSYRFRVIAANSDGVWNESGDSFEFYLRPAVYQTWYFYLACFAAVALLGQGAHRYRVRQLVRHNEELHRMQLQLEAKNLELELKHSEVEAKNVELERFTYTVSHDLKSPLFTVEGFLGMLEKDAAAGDRERMDADMQYIRAATTKMGRLLEELLELSRIGRMVNPPEEVPLSELAREAVELVAGRIAERGVELVIPPEMPTVVGDRPRLLEVLQNLIENAVKFMGPQEKPRVEITAVEEQGETVCHVRDNGIGIDPRYHEKVFGLFDKLDPQVEGTGIGLALVRRIIEVHGGRVRVESEGEGRGSTFSFSIPQKASGRS
ncbi:MAG: hypothetical protein GY856_22260 [bacterium]|nr:hypothetical protein [bacterium]